MIKQNVSRRQFLNLMGATSVVAAGLGLAACGSGSASSSSAEGSSSSASTLSGSINCTGATSFQTLVEDAANAFMDSHEDVTITIGAGGSGQGLSDVKDGTAQIGRSDIFAEQKLEASDAAALTDNQVAVVGMGPIVNSGVDIDDISTADLKGIFTGAITDWSQVSGSKTSGAIQVINRKAGSGTRATFEQAVLQGATVPDDFKPVAEEDSSGTVVEKVNQTENSISYLAFSYYDDSKFKALPVDGVAATNENVESGDFNIWAYEHMYTKDANDVTQAFIDYMLSDDVQGSLVEKDGFISVSKMKVSKDMDGNITKS
ncbi:MAG: phosphate ABC transporter substrate-binding protein [Atopobiaceae bacterium]|nr:phosphate ABC transporter substrate-binding protein [Olegusella sp.]MCI1934838.1 phosphate ABC transporter substrate-binding protein [Atopobiaceae bacterium]NLH92313.1 phosphate ABC transporter substrate-binding protein [Atopobium sp.]